MAAPLWLLDVDGVLNVNPGKPRWHAAPRKVTVRPGDGKEYVVRWAPVLIVRIRELHRHGVEIRWASSWIGHTDVLARVLGLPNFEPAYTPSPGWGSAEHTTAKLRAAGEAACDGRRVIWTDDEAIPPHWSGAYRSLAEVWNALLIAPQPNRGLTPEHMDTIEAFAGLRAGVRS